MHGADNRGFPALFHSRNKLQNAKVKDIVNVDLDITVYVLYKNEVDEYFKRLVENDVASQNFRLANSLQEADLIWK